MKTDFYISVGAAVQSNAIQYKLRNEYYLNEVVLFLTLC